MIGNLYLVLEFVKLIDEALLLGSELREFMEGVQYQLT